MRVFVYEYLSSGALAEAAAAPSLQMEGWAMLSAVLRDFSRCPNVEAMTLIDPRLLPHVEGRFAGVVPRTATVGTEASIFRELAARADWSLVIAPEFEDILAVRSRWVEEAGGRLLGSTPNAIRQTADKLALLQRWKERAIPTPSAASPYPAVCKPRFGAGSQATFLIRDEDERDRALRQAAREDWHGEMMVQPYAPGRAASVAFLASRTEWHALPAVEQHLSDEGRFRYLGGRLPLPEALDRRARHLAERAARCIEGLQGWFGVDLILGAEAAADVAIEINPRLTTSYAGLRRLASFNLAEAMLNLATGGARPHGDWKRDAIAFRANGEIIEGLE